MRLQCYSASNLHKEQAAFLEILESMMIYLFLLKVAKFVNKSMVVFQFTIFHATPLKMA